MFKTLISAAELVSHKEDSNLVVLDCRHDLMDHSAGQAAYDQGHIPGALFVNLEQHLSAAKVGADGQFRGRHPLPEKENFIASLRSFGINDDSQVVVYDAQGGMYAARLWWMLRWIGHTDVAVLDGGLPAWQAAGQPLTTEVPAASTGNISEQRLTMALTVDVIQVLGNISSAAKTLVDARAADRFRGENETIDPVGGHIPGAKNRFFKDNLQADGRFKSAEQLQQEWSVIVGDASRAIMQCGSGVTACHNLLALEVAGMHGAVLYPGSWSEWCADSGRPVER